jgi:hypothetical protein
MIFKKLRTHTKEQKKTSKGRFFLDKQKLYLRNITNLDKYFLNCKSPSELFQAN